MRAGRTFLAWGPSVCCAGLESAEDFWYRVYVTACRGGLRQQTRRVVVLGAGAEGIWKRAAHFLGAPGLTVVESVDLYHASDHLWAVGRARWDTPAAVSAWVEPLKDALYTQGAPAVLAARDAVVPSAAAADLLRTPRAYCADNAARLAYPRFVAQQLPIGAGAVERRCTSLIAARRKHAGMRWTPAAAPASATRRAVQAADQWDAFWATHPLRTHLRLCPPASPARHPGDGPRAGGYRVSAAACGAPSASATTGPALRVPRAAPLPCAVPSVAPRPHWPGPLCVTRSQSRGAPHYRPSLAHRSSSCYTPT